MEPYTRQLDWIAQQQQGTSGLVHKPDFVPVHEFLFQTRAVRGLHCRELDKAEGGELFWDKATGLFGVRPLRSAAAGSSGSWYCVARHEMQVLGAWFARLGEELGPPPCRRPLASCLLLANPGPNKWNRIVELQTVLQVVLTEWIPTAVVVLSGSSRLGITDLDCDVDMCCLIPASCGVSRNLFFDLMADMLAHVPQRFGAITLVSDTAVPLLKFTYVGELDVDLLLAVSEVGGLLKERHVLDEEVMAGMQDACSLASWSGPRNAEMLRQLTAPHDQFVPALRLVRRWAKSRGIYSSKLGYLGGMSWSILVAMACQLLPQASTAMELLRGFFYVLCRWDWSTQAVQLCPASATHSTQGSIMSILTPAQPTTNTSYTVTFSTKKTIVGEFARADGLHESWCKGEIPELYFALMQPVKPPSPDDEYVIRVVLTNTNTKEQALASNQVSMLESKLRKLTKLLENVQQVDQVRVFPQPCKVSPTAVCFYLALGPKPPPAVLADTKLSIDATFHYFCSQCRLTDCTLVLEHL